LTSLFAILVGCTLVSTDAPPPPVASGATGHTADTGPSVPTTAPLTTDTWVPVGNVQPTCGEPVDGCRSERRGIRLCVDASGDSPYGRVRGSFVSRDASETYPFWVFRSTDGEEYQVTEYGNDPSWVPELIGLGEVELDSPGNCEWGGSLRVFDPTDGHLLLASSPGGAPGLFEAELLDDHPVCPAWPGKCFAWHRTVPVAFDMDGQTVELLPGHTGFLGDHEVYLFSSDDHGPHVDCSFDVGPIPWTSLILHKDLSTAATACAQAQP